MFRWLLAGIVAVGLVAASQPMAMAQRRSDAKARGEFGRGFWSADHSSTMARGVTYQAARPAESYRSFSYEPVAIQVGDTVVVSGEHQLMLGSKAVATAPAGLEFKVVEERGGWLGAIVEIDGQQRSGWLWHSNVTRK